MIYALCFLSLITSIFSEYSASIVCMENDPSVLVDGKVNAITGDLVCFEQDLVIQGAEPIRISRSYIGEPKKGESEAWWLLFDFTVVVDEVDDKKWMIYEKNGSQISYSEVEEFKTDGKKFHRCEPKNIDWGSCNTSHGEISSRTNIRNNYLIFDDRYKHLWVHSSNGSVRFYKQMRKSNQFLLIEEKLPNGHWLIYDYQQIQEKPPAFNLTSIRSTNASKEIVYAKADIIREDYKITVHGSDGQSVQYYFQKPTKKDPGEGIYRVVSSQAADVSYVYPTFKNEIKKALGLFSGIERRLGTISYPLQRTVSFDYYNQANEIFHEHPVEMHDYFEGVSLMLDPRRGRVKKITAPVGIKKEITHSFVYDLKNRTTHVYDIEGFRTDYLWEFDSRIRTIGRYSKEGKLVGKDRFTWMGNELKTKTYADEIGLPICSKLYNYDKRGNVLEEKFFGNLSGQGPIIGFNRNAEPEKGESLSKRFTYTSSVPNLLIESVEESGLRTVYSYLSGTDLPVSLLIYDRQQLKMRKFWDYNTDNLLISEISDDGSSEEKTNMHGIHTRLIKKFTLLESGPYVGMPSTIEEKYWENDRELLLKKTHLSYTTGGRVEHLDIYDANDQFVYRLTYTYDEKGRLKSEMNPLGQVQRYTYDLCGNKIASKDFSDRMTTSVEYDHSNRAIFSKKVGFDEVTQFSKFTYDRKHHLIKESDHRSIETCYVYDQQGRKTETTFPEISATVQSTYDSAGNQILRVDAEGNSTKTTYNAYGKPICITHPDGAQDQYLYYFNGLLKSHTDPLGIKTEFIYDYLGRVIKKIRANLAEETWEYSGHLLVGETDAEGNRTRYFHDGAGRKIGEEFAGEKTAYFYDSLGRVCKIQKEEVCFVKGYDLLDRVIEERSETLSGQVLRKVAYEYDAAGNRTTLIRWVGSEISKEAYTYDSFNRMVQKKDPLENLEFTSYDEAFENEQGQNVLQKTHLDPLGLKTIQTMDTRGRLSMLEKKKEKTLFRETKTYSKNGYLTAQVNAIFNPDRQMNTRWEYDSRGRLTKLIESDTKTTGYAYNLRGERIEVSNPNGTRLFYEYNNLGMNTSIKSSDFSISHEMKHNKLGHILESEGIERTFDARGRVLTETFPQGYGISNTYDLMGRRTHSKVAKADCILEYENGPLDLHSISRKTVDGDLLYRHTYGERDLSGALLQEESLLGPITYTYDRLARKTSIQAPYFTQTIHEYDPVGNIRKMQIQEDHLDFSYDDLYQLTSEPNHSYAHDALNNRIQKNGIPQEINALNQDVSNFKYDANGNAVEFGNTKYHYDALNRLIRIDAPGFIQMFTYDALHRCLSRVTLENNTQETRYYLYDGQNEIGAFDENLAPVELRVLGSTPHAEIGSAIAIELNGHVYVPYHDLQGNIASLSPYSWGWTTYYRYTAFGEETTNGTAPNPWKFSSKRTDPRTGLVYFGRRFYQPAHGRWLTPDPSGFADGMNLYAYVHNDPLTHNDEYGLITYHYRDGWTNNPWGSEYSWSHSQFSQHPPKSDPRLLHSLDPYPKGTPNFYVNGINNSRADNLAGANTLLQTYSNQANVVPFHSESFGKVDDLRSVYNSKHVENYTTYAIRRLNRELKFNIYNLESLNDPRKVFITCFSRGSTDTYHAVKNFSLDESNRLIITSCGPIMILPRKLGFKVTNLVSKGDWCSMQCNSGLEKNIEKYKSYADVYLLDMKDGFWSVTRDHFFQSKTYQGGLVRHAVDDYKEFGVTK